MQVDAACGLAAVGAEVEDACRSLVLASPEALRRCEKALQQAAEALRQGQSAWDWRSSGQTARTEVSRLQAGIRRAGRLLSSVYGYQAGWLRILSAMTGGYSPHGEAIPLPGLRCMSLEG